MEEGTFVRWLKADGEAVRAGEPLFELEGDKAIQEIEAIDSGTLRIPANAPPPGSTVQVGALIGHLLADGEAADADLAHAGADTASAPPAASSHDATARAAPAQVGRISDPSATPPPARQARRHRASPRSPGRCGAGR